MPRPASTIAMAAAVALTLAACGGETDQTQTSPPVVGPSEGSSSTDGGDAISSTNVVPAVDVINVDDGTTVDLQDEVLPSETPVLLWAWAPHCPTCRAEAPAVEEFAAANTEDVSVVGLGTQDDLAYAEEFVATTGVTTPEMLWDPSFESWAHFGITSQPSWVLVDGGGEFLGEWVGPLPEDEVLDLAREA